MKKLVFMSLFGLALLAGCGGGCCQKPCEPVCKEEVCCDAKRSPSKEVGWTEADYK